MKTISLIKIFSLTCCLFFISCKDDDNSNTVSCELSFESTLIINDSANEADYVFEATPLESESNVVYSWTINDVSIAETSNVLETVFIQNGTYTVCVSSETPECPNAVTACQEIIVDSLSEDTDQTVTECPEISFEVLIQDNNYRFEATEQPNTITANYAWSINGEFIENGLFDGNNNEFFSFDFTENGTYNVCAFIETPECPLGVMYCQDIVITTIDDNTTGLFDISVTNPIQIKSLETCVDLTYSYTKKDNDTFTLAVDNAEQIGGGFSWFINGDFIESGATINYQFVDASTYTICVIQETPECPNTVSFCRDFLVENIN